MLMSIDMSHKGTGSSIRYLELAEFETLDCTPQNACRGSGHVERAGMLESIASAVEQQICTCSHFFALGSSELPK